MQLAQSVLVACLLGVTGWLSLATIQNRDDILRMRTQLDERGHILERLQTGLDTVTAKQQEVLGKLIKLEDSDAACERRLNWLEGHAK